MPAFRSSGSTGQAPTTVWMNYVADKYTMLSPYQDAAPNAQINSSHTTLIACKFTNLFNAINSSFGAFTTAPDGTTNTAQKIVEDNTTNQHVVQAAWNSPQNPAILPILRDAGIFKAAERTRVAAQFNGFGGNIGNTAFVGFDLAGGQIAYGPSYTGSASTDFPIVNFGMFPVGLGFWVCFIDCQGLHLTDSAVSCRFLLDNGSGTAAASLSYAGNGTSGIYGWKASMLPAQAWAINGSVFFDDFNDPTMANIDLNNTFAPGFAWYVQADFQNWVGLTAGRQNAATAIPPGTLSVSSSIIKIPAMTGDLGAPFHNGNPGALTTFGNASSRGNVPGVGTGWRPPVMFESSFAWNYTAGWQNGDVGPFGGWIEYADFAHANVSPGNGAINGGEFELCETLNGGNYAPQAGQFFYATAIGQFPSATPGDFFIPANSSQIRANIGYPPFESTYSYGGGEVVTFSGTFYFASAGMAVGTTPPAAPWTVYTYPTTGGSLGPADPNIATDPSQQHVYTDIYLPYNRTTKDRGCRLHFYDGVFRFMTMFWAPNVGPPGTDASNPYFHTVDWMRFFMMFWQNTNNRAGSGLDMFVDYFRVSQ